jgi:phosphoribosylpyrophosphate synthetase
MCPACASVGVLSIAAVVSRAGLTKLAHRAISEVFVTDTVAVEESDRPRVRVVSVARMMAACLQRLMAGGWRKHEPTSV